MRPELIISGLESAGYEIFLDGECIKYRYRPPGELPANASKLLEELINSKAEVVEILKRRNARTQGENIVLKEFNTAVAWQNPHPQGTHAAKHECLLQCMLAMWDALCDPLYQRGFRMTDDISAAETYAVAVYTAVRKGKAKLSEFRSACQELRTKIYEQSIK